MSIVKILAQRLQLRGLEFSHLHSAPRIAGRISAAYIRFNTGRDHTDDDYGENYLQAQNIIAKLVHEYNEQRLHAALGNMQPAVWHRGYPLQRRQERADKLHSAKMLRRAINQQRQQEALAA